MKKTLVILSAVLALMSCAKITETEIEKAPKEDETIVSNPVTFNISVADMETKAASKNAWTDGDKIYVVFKGLTTKYLLLTYNSGTDTWDETPSTAFDESDFTGLAEKMITSVFFPVDVTPALSAGVLSFTDGSSNPVYTYYLKEEEKAYTVDGATVNLNISLGIAGSYAQFHIPGIQASVADYTFKANLVQPVACSSITASSGAITENEAANGAPFKGFADADGGVFSARIVDTGVNHDYTFTLISTNNVYTFEKNRSLAAGKFYKFKGLSDASWQKTFGQFTINAGGDKVTFSPGNLQYDGTAWSFHTNQWDVLDTWSSTGCDHFYWEKSGNYGSEENYTGDSSATVDWGDNLGVGWNTLSSAEWAYLFSGRTNASNLYGYATVNEVHGVILLPDNSGLSIDITRDAWGDNVYSESSSPKWSEMETAGVVFLPAAGARNGMGSDGGTVADNGDVGLYWSSTKYDNDSANSVYFTNSYCSADSRLPRQFAAGVRLVKSVSASAPAINVVNLGSLTSDYVAQNNEVLTGTLAGNYKISIADGATVTLKNVTINGVNDGDYEWAGITCLGNATITLSGANTVTGFCSEYPGIQAAHNNTGVGDEYTLTIHGTGSLTASSNGKAAGIGAAKTDDCGNITISGGTITATGGDQAAGIGGSNYGECGNISISGGTITATGGDDAAGIGSGADNVAACSNITISGGTIIATGKYSGAGIGSGNNGASCGNITITSGVTRVTATKGSSATNSIGAGKNGTCGTVNIGGTVYYQDNAYVSDGATYLTSNPLVFFVLVNGIFSVADGKQIQFSRGNLQYTKSTATWSFMPRQYSTVETNDDIYCTENYGNKDVVSLFGWGTSGQNHGAVAYQPYSTSMDWDAYDAYGNTDNNLYDSDGKADWGYNMGTGWRTLTQAEWRYLFNTRCYYEASYKWGLATVVGVTGLVILPDSWSLPDGCTFSYGSSSGWTTNSYDADKWALMEAAGAVFLPAAGNRFERSVSFVGNWGYYWCSSIYAGNHSCADDLEFNSGGLGSLTNSGGNKFVGMSVRLVIDAN